MKGLNIVNGEGKSLDRFASYDLISRALKTRSDRYEPVLEQNSNTDNVFLSVYRDSKTSAVVSLVGAGWGNTLPLALFGEEPQMEETQRDLEEILSKFKLSVKKL